MEEPVEIELEDPVLEENPQAGELVFRFWVGEVLGPVVEFTCMDPEARADHVLTDVEALVAASYLGYLRRMVECVLHLQKTIKRGE